MGEDFKLYLQCLVNGARFVLTQDAYYFYRSRLSSLVTKCKRKRFDQSCRTLLDFLQQDSVKTNQQLVCSLSKNLVIFEKNRAYYSVVEPLRQGKLLIALTEMIHNPYFFVHFIIKLRGILTRRLQYYLLGNKLVYEPMYPRSKS